MIKFKLIAAVENLAYIGYTDDRGKSRLPTFPMWDMQKVVEQTKNAVVLIGERTLRSIPNGLDTRGIQLLVLASRNTNHGELKQEYPHIIEVFSNLDEIKEYCQENVSHYPTNTNFVCLGGGVLYDYIISNNMVNVYDLTIKFDPKDTLSKLPHTRLVTSAEIMGKVEYFLGLFDMMADVEVQKTFSHEYNIINLKRMKDLTLLLSNRNVVYLDLQVVVGEMSLDFTKVRLFKVDELICENYHGFPN